MSATAIVHPPGIALLLRFVRFAALDNWGASSSTGRLGFHAATPLRPLGEALMTARHPITVQNGATYQRVTVRINGGGVLRRDTVSGSVIKTKRQFRVAVGQLIMSRIDARNGAFGLIPADLDGAIVTNDFPVFDVRSDRMLPDYLRLVVSTRQFREYCQTLSKGTTNRQRMDEATFLSIPIPFPLLAEQKKLVVAHRVATAEAQTAEARARECEQQAATFLETSLGLKAQAEKTKLTAAKLYFTRFVSLERWGELLLNNSSAFVACRHPLVSGRECLLEVKHGCSVSPSDQPTGLEVLKISAVTRGALNDLERKHLPDRLDIRLAYALRSGDVLMCRTNGTIGYVGMSALVDEDRPNLVFPDKVIRVRVRPDRVLPRFFWMLAQSSFVRRQIEQAARTTAGNYAIGGKDIWNFQFPLPPLSEQEHIVCQLDILRAQARTARATAAACREAAATAFHAALFGHD